MTASIYGTHGDTGDRSLLWSLQNVQQGDDNESFLVVVDAVELGELDKVVLLISSKTDCKLDIKKLHLKEALKEYPIYVFEVNEAFSVDADKPEIQREIPVSFIIRGDKQKNDIDNNLHKKGSKASNLTEYTIKVYTGDQRGAGTDANVHIILFGNEDKSEVFQLSQSLEHQDPFERGKVDTFKIKTKKIGSLYSIEIGHDGKGFASGWFLEKVEITDTSSNSVYCFSCNREQRRYSLWDCLWILAALAVYFADVGTDIWLAVDYYLRGQRWWFGLTLFFVLLGSLSVQVFSFRWFAHDFSTEDSAAAAAGHCPAAESKLLVSSGSAAADIDAARPCTPQRQASTASKSNATNSSSNSSSNAAGSGAAGPRAGGGRSASCAFCIWLLQSLVHILQLGQVWR
ncbi:hypothetical protein Q9966_010083 [Columba livia]|nr:hypothetical protein Q9966_010083 [Columba livia]